MFDIDGRPLHVSWTYSRAELIADAVVHIVGIVLAVVGAVAMVVLATRHSTPAETLAVALYATVLIGLLGISAAYNMWPISRTKWVLRRIDHAFIFLLIAATYTPFMTRISAGAVGTALFAGVWTVAILAAAVKIAMPGRFDRASIALCILLGASGAIAWEPVWNTLSATTLALILAGCATYVGGVVFHLWDGLRFQNAVWHGCVLVASALFYVAILGGIVLA